MNSICFSKLTNNSIHNHFFLVNHSQINYLISGKIRDLLVYSKVKFYEPTLVAALVLCFPAGH